VYEAFIYDLKLQDKYNTCALSKHIGKYVYSARNAGKGSAKPRTIGKHSRLNRQIWYRHQNSEAGNDEIQNVNMDFYFVGITF
jgi:hypothetical protein